MATIEIDTLIIGGGQAGLATSYYLTRQGHRHVVLEQSEKAAAAWRNQKLGFIHARDTELVI